MATLTIDTHKFITRLQAAGMDERQAVAIVEGLKEEANLHNVVTSADLRTAVAELKADLLKWLIPVLLGQIAVFAAVVKFLIA